MFARSRSIGVHHWRIAQEAEISSPHEFPPYAPLTAAAVWTLEGLGYAQEPLSATDKPENACAHDAVRDVEQCGHSGTQPRSRHIKKFANPRRLRSRTLFATFIVSLQASARAAEKTDLPSVLNWKPYQLPGPAEEPPPGLSVMATRVD